MPKHAVATTVDNYGDHLATVIGGVSFAALVGFISIVIGPDAASGELFDLGGVAFSFGTYSLSLAAGLAAIAAMFAYGTNQAVNAITNVGESWKTYEGAAVLFGVGFPLSISFSPTVTGYFAGSIEAQALGLGAYLGAMFLLNEY